MPIVGIRCPNDDKVDFDHCLEKCKNECIPYPIRLRMIDDQLNNYHRGDTITATSFITCIRKTFLERTQPYYDSLDSLWPSCRGTWMHGILESLKGDIRWLVEERFFVDYKGVQISGQVDAYHKSTKRLYDYKTTLDKNVTYILSNGAKKDHSVQASIYAYIMGKNNVNVRSASISYMSMAEVYTCDNVFLHSNETVERYFDLYALPLHEAFKTGIMPDPPDPRPIWLCQRYCQVEHFCHAVS